VLKILQSDQQKAAARKDQVNQPLWVLFIFYINLAQGV
jgi:hypothetical protein